MMKKKPHMAMSGAIVQRRRSQYSAQELAILMKAFYRNIHKEYIPPMGFTKEWVLSIEKNAGAHPYFHVMFYLSYLGCTPRLKGSLLRAMEHASQPLTYQDDEEVRGQEPEGTGND